MNKLLKLVTILNGLMTISLYTMALPIMKISYLTKLDYYDYNSDLVYEEKNIRESSTNVNINENIDTNAKYISNANTIMNTNADKKQVNININDNYISNVLLNKTPKNQRVISNIFSNPNNAKNVVQQTTNVVEAANKDVFKLTRIYHTNSNLCFTFSKLEYRVKLERCTKNNGNQQWYLPAQGANYWILASTISFSENSDTANQFEVDAGTIQQYFDGNTVCVFINKKGNILSSSCLDGQNVKATLMDAVDFSSSENVIKSSAVNSNSCVDVFPDDTANYENHQQQIKVCNNYKVSPINLTVNNIRLYTTQCSGTDIQKWSFFATYTDLQNFQNYAFNPNNYPEISKVQSDVTNIYLKVKEVRNLNLEIFAGENKFTYYPNTQFTVSDNRIADVNMSQNNLHIRDVKKSSGISIIGKSEGTTVFTVQVHDKVLRFNIFVSDATDKISFIDIQTYKDNVGDCIILQSVDANNQPIYAMIDTGKQGTESYTKMLAFLRDNGVKRLEWLLITHFHSDHYGGIDQLLESNIIINSIYMKQYHAWDSNYSSLKYKDVAEFRQLRLNDWNKMLANIDVHRVPINYVAPGQNEKVDLGNYHITFLNSDEAFQGFADICEEFKNCNENTNSIISVVENNGRFYYLNSDIDTYSTSFSTSTDERLKAVYEQHMVDKWVSYAMETHNMKYIDVLKAGHHGTLYNNIENVFLLAKAPIGVVTTEPESLRNRRTILENRFKAGNDQVQVYYSGNGIIMLNQNSKGKINVVQGFDEHTLN